MVLNSLAEIVNKIEIKGNDRVSKTTIINFSKINKGDDINSDTLNKSLKSLYETNFFEDVNIDFQNNILFINVKEYPIIQSIIFEGIKKQSLIKEFKETLSLKEKILSMSFKLKKMSILFLILLKNQVTIL